MKLVIRTLALLLALSSTAVAEDWADAPIAGGAGFIWYDDHPSIPDGVAAVTALPSSYDYAVQVGCNVARSYVLGGLVGGAISHCPPNVVEAVFPVSIAQFARSDRLDSVSGRVTALEANAAAYATTASVDGVASRVTAIEGSLGSFASVGSLNGVAARVSAIEASVGSFATTSNLNALATRVAAAESQLAAIQSGVADLAAFVPEALGDIRRQADEGSAMAAAMTTVAPADGKANRIGFNTATYNGSTAVAVSYSRAAGDVDFNVGVAMAGENAMVKAGAGFSW